MRAIRVPAVLIAAALALSASESGAQSVPGVDNIDWTRQNVTFTADALRAYNQLVTQWSEAWRARDVKKISDLYSVGATVAFSGGELIRGREAVFRTLSTQLPSTSDMRVSATDFVSSGDVMSATGPYVFDAGDGELLTGTYSMTLRIESGRWRIRSQVFSPELPLSEPVAADSADGTDGL